MIGAVTPHYDRRINVPHKSLSKPTLGKSLSVTLRQDSNQAQPFTNHFGSRHFGSLSFYSFIFKRKT